jgi:hypothetical protein
MLKEKAAPKAAALDIPRVKGEQRIAQYGLHHNTCNCQARPPQWLSGLAVTEVIVAVPG